MSSRPSPPAIPITGPRQSGKTTLAREIFGDRPYVSLVLHRGDEDRSAAGIRYLPWYRAASLVAAGAGPETA